MSTDHSRSVHTTWLYTLGSIVFFVGFFTVFVAFAMLETYLADPWPLAAAVIVLYLVCGAIQVRYCWFLRAGLGGGLPAVGWTVVLYAVAAAIWVLGAFVPGFGLLAATPIWVASCLVATLVRRPVRWPLIGASAALVIAHVMLAASITGQPTGFPVNGTAWPVLIYAALLPPMLLSSLWWWQVVVRLDESRRVAAELAITQERLRFASDLHDIQGHHLQVISLKSELAERLLDRDPTAARENIHEVRLIAKEALEETRSLVAGYRQVALDVELENAREVLTASGATCELRIADLPTDAAARSALASVVREATTNILRHSDARHVSIELRVDHARADPRGVDHGRWVLEIGNDGVTEVSGAAGGTGLDGLRARLAAVGGELATTADAEGGFELRAEVPVVAEVHA